VARKTEMESYRSCVSWIGRNLTWNTESSLVKVMGCLLCLKISKGSYPVRRFSGVQKCKKCSEFHRTVGGHQWGNENGRSNRVECCKTEEEGDLCIDNSNWSSKVCLDEQSMEAKKVMKP